MDFGRPLSEAAKIEIPNALSFMHDITHKSGPLTEIYQTILGTPFTFDEGEDKNKRVEEEKEENTEGVETSLMRAFNLKMPGACAISWSDLAEKAAGSESAQDPNNNPREAYKAKRRNICTFDRYLKFMNLGEPGLGEGPEGPDTPLYLYGKYLEDRRPLAIYQTEVVYDPVMPEKEQNIPEKTSEKPEGQKPSSQQAEEKGKKEEDQKGKLVRVKQTMDVRDLLISIAKREFSRRIYK